jgi:hypothetical protein
MTPDGLPEICCCSFKIPKSIFRRPPIISPISDPWAFVRLVNYGHHDQSVSLCIYIDM